MPSLTLYFLDLNPLKKSSNYFFSDLFRKKPMQKNDKKKDSRGLREKSEMKSKLEANGAEL